MLLASDRLSHQVMKEFGKTGLENAVIRANLIWKNLMV